MKLPIRLLTLPVVVSALALQLNGCGESSNNLADPVVDRGNTITNCDSEENKDICVTGQFIDEPVVGLNYSCNKVTGITDGEGTFACPNNSVVTFYLQAKTGKYKITLGSYLARAVGDLSGKPLKIVLQMTPKDLVKTVAEREVIGDDIDGIQVTNVLRLLQALDSDGSFSQKVLNRIVLTEDSKKEIDLLAKDISTGIFAENDVFEETLKPYLDKLGKTLPTATAAVAQFNQSLPALMSGVYEVNPLTLPSVDDITGETFYTGMFGQSSTSNLRAFESLFFILDRDGKSIGLGMEWQTTLTQAELDNTLLQRLLVEKEPTQLKFVSEDIGFKVNGAIKPNFTLTAADGGTVSIQQGHLLKGNISGNRFFYRTVYGLTNSEVDSTKFGKWKRFNSAGQEILSGTVNMNKTRTIAAYLDSSVWRTNESVAVGEKPIFPLHLKLTLRDRDVGNSSCTAQGCLVGTIGMSILENGNIISDRDNDCSIVDTNLQDKAVADTEVVQEHRLGMVSATVLKDASDAPIKAIAPIIMIGQWANQLPEADTWKKFYGIAIGMQSIAGGPKVQINLDGLLTNNAVSMTNQLDEQKNSGIVARWTDYITTLRALNKDLNASLAPKSQGLITNIETQSCYSPVPKV